MGGVIGWDRRVIGKWGVKRDFACSLCEGNQVQLPADTKEFAREPQRDE